MIVRRECAKCHKNRAEKFYTGPRGRICGFCRKKRVQHASREVRLLETYGITADEYAAILEAQHGACAICEKVYRYNLDVDHDHAVVKNLVGDHGWAPLAAMRASIRGLLCKRCNRRMLPAASDDPYTLERAADYLRYGDALVAEALAGSVDAEAA